MTAGKRAKGEVRARMERTGETYMAAWRAIQRERQEQVRADRDVPAPMGVAQAPAAEVPCACGCGRPAGVRLRWKKHQGSRRDGGREPGAPRRAAAPWTGEMFFPACADAQERQLRDAGFYTKRRAEI